jgi:hypothetical protein
VNRVPVDLVVLVLAQSGITVNARQIRNWRLRGHITRTTDGYDLTEVLAYIERRDLNQQRGIEHACPA